MPDYEGMGQMPAEVVAVLRRLGDKEAVEDWWNEPHRRLDRRAPRDAWATKTGQTRVRKLLKGLR